MIIKRDCICTPVGKNRPLHIYLPPEYGDPANAGSRYPVMYFFDGHNLFRDEDATYGKSWGLETFLDNWVKPMIIVGFECGHEGRERLDEYSPYFFDNDYIGRVDGIGDEILRWITEEVKPRIDGEFRTWYFREATGIGGSSMGGLMSLYAAAKFNRYFSKAACVSPAIIPCAEELLRDITDSEMDPDTRLWVSYGESEARGRSSRAKSISATRVAKTADRMLRVLEEKNVMKRLYVQPRGRHCEADWEKQVPMFMEYLWF